MASLQSQHAAELAALEASLNEKHATLQEQHTTLQKQHASDIGKLNSKLQSLEQALDDKVDDLMRKDEELGERMGRSQAVLVTNLHNTQPAFGDILRFKTVKYGSGYNAESGAFVAAHSGTYLVTFTMHASTRNSGASSVGVYLYKANARYLTSAANVDSSSDSNSVTLTAVVALQKGQTLDVRAYTSRMRINGPFFAVALLHIEE